MKLFQGILADLRTRTPSYVSDFTDAWHRKVVSSSFYLFFACLANAIAFGTLSGMMTSGEIGVIEMLIATAAGGIVYALFSAQPITLLGGTGPIVIFTSLLYAICFQLDLQFIGVYAWCGLWAGFFLVLLSITNASSLMRYFSRFTDDIFAALVSVIFIIEAVKSIYRAMPMDSVSTPIAWLGVLLALGTCALAFGLRATVRIGASPTRLTHILFDFAPTVAIVTMALLATVIGLVLIEGPSVPMSFESTTSGRPWLIVLNDVPAWARFGAIVPGFFAAILLYMDQNITSRIINESEAPLKKGHGYHIDLLIIGALTIVFSLFGLPWIVAATVHSVNHLSSLTCEDHNPATPSLSVVENRVSALLIHTGMAISLFFLPLVRLIPMPVLFGLFIFMGIVSLQGNAFVIRLIALLTPSILEKSENDDRRASAAGRLRYTFVQGGSFVILWVVKSSVLGILFPVFIALCVPVRMLLSRIISTDDLGFLDDYHPDVDLSA